MSDSAIEYRWSIGGAGSEGLLAFDGRVIEFFNLYSGGSNRYPYPETTVERSEPNRKGKVDFKFLSAAGNLVSEFEVEAEHVAGFDDFLAKVEKARGG